jgi:hypothetical protein
MKLFRILFPILVASLFLAPAIAQEQQSSQPYSPQKPSAQNPQPNAPAGPEQPAPDFASPAPAPAGPMWLPQGIAALGQYASNRTEFTLDHSMLVLATKLDRDNQDLRRVIAGVSGVSVHSFHYPGAVSVDPIALGSLEQEYRDAGFLHLVSKHRGESGLTTDLWLRMDGSSIRDVAVLWTGSRDLNLLVVSGSIAPIDVLHLGGHFGIPRMDGGVVIPTPRQ